MDGKSFEIFTQTLSYIIKYFKWVVTGAVVLILLSGIYRVESNEAAVVLRFGRLVGNTGEQQVKQPGLHFSLPFFIDEVIKIPVQTVHEKEITTHYGGEGKAVASTIENSGYLLTGDHNIILIKAKIKFKIDDVVQYALYNDNPESAVSGIISGELVRSITHMDIDSILTSGKAELSFRIMENAQRLLNELNTGILITNVELTDIVPPAETKEYFEEVINASVNKQTAIQQAREYAATTLLNAESSANSYKQEAIHIQAEALTVVRAEIAEFNGVYEQYIKDPQIIISGTFRQRVSDILAKMGGTVIIPAGGEAPVIVMP